MEARISSLEDARQRAEIERRYLQTITEWHHHMDLALRMTRAEYKMKCHIAKCLRDAELRNLERDEDD